MGAISRSTHSRTFRISMPGRITPPQELLGLPQPQRHRRHRADRCPGFSDASLLQGEPHGGIDLRDCLSVPLADHPERRPACQAWRADAYLHEKLAAPQHRLLRAEEELFGRDRARACRRGENERGVERHEGRKRVPAGGCVADIAPDGGEVPDLGRADGARALHQARGKVTPRGDLGDGDGRADCEPLRRPADPAQSGNGADVKQHLRLDKTVGNDHAEIGSARDGPHVFRGAEQREGLFNGLYGAVLHDPSLARAARSAAIHALTRLFVACHCPTRSYMNRAALRRPAAASASSADTSTTGPVQPMAGSQ